MNKALVFGIGASVSLYVLDPLQLTTRRHQLSKDYDPSIKEFVSEMSKNGRFAPATSGFSWRNGKEEVKKDLTELFQDLGDTFDLIPTQTTGVKAPADDLPQQTFQVQIRKNIEAQRPTNEQAFSIVAGGIPALWTAYMQSVIYAEGSAPGMLPPVYILPPNIKYSAAFGSSIQFHVSHASPMYADPEFSVLKILWTSVMRNVGWDNPERDNYMIGEIKPSAFFEWDVLKVGLGFFYNEWKFKLQRSMGWPTILHKTIPIAIKSGKVMEVTEKEIGKQILQRKDTIRVAYDESETKEMLELQQDLQAYDVISRQLTSDEAKKSGTIPQIGKGGSIWTVNGDGNLSSQTFDHLIEAMKKNGATIIEGWITDVHYSEQDKTVVGISVQEEGKKRFIATNRVFTSFGAQTGYQCKEKIKDYKPVETIILGTGYSAFLLVDGDISQPIDSNNTHFTPLSVSKRESGEAVTLVKTTCGGAIGSQSFCIDHAINSLFYAAHVVFPRSKVQLVAARSCSRPLNTQNSGRVEEILPGFLVGSGYGGKGVTDAAGMSIDAAVRLSTGLVPQTAINRFLRKYDKDSVKEENVDVEVKNPRLLNKA